MSDTEKTEAPTPKRRQDARDEGQLPRSTEVGTAALLLASAVALGPVGSSAARRITEIFGFGLVAVGSGPMDAEGATALIQSVAGRALFAVAPVMLLLAGTSLAVGAMQGRGVVSAKGFAPKWERLSPLSNGKRLVGMQPWIDLLKSFLKLAIVGMAVKGVLLDVWPRLMTLGQQGPGAFLSLAQGNARTLLTRAGMAYLALALGDYLYQVWTHEKQLRMSREEIKQEMKQSEGDPLLRARMRSVGRSLARRQMFAEVPKADVVITNPTHIAVALVYDPDKAAAPVVIAMGQRKVAQRIKAIAREAGVPTIENKPLARALLRSAQVGMTIPPELYVAVAEILAFVIRRRGGAEAP